MTGTNVNPMAALIAGAMRDESTALNRSAALIALMFGNEVSYSMPALASILKLEKSEKTEAIDTAICDVSPEFEVMRDNDMALAEKRKADKANYSDRDAENRVVFGKQMRAARIMFERALIATYGLRKNNALEVVASKRRTGMLSVEFLKSRDGDKIKTTDKDLSCNDLIRAGNAALAEANVRKAKTVTAKNPAANVIADASKSLAAVLSNLGNDGKRKPITDFSDAVEADLETTLRELFAMKFADDKGVIDGKAAALWIAETFKPVAPKQEVKEVKAA